MAKFSWTVTEDSDTVSLPQLIKKCVLIFYLCMLLWMILLPAIIYLFFNFLLLEILRFISDVNPLW